MHGQITMDSMPPVTCPSCGADRDWLILLDDPIEIHCRCGRHWRDTRIPLSAFPPHAFEIEDDTIRYANTDEAGQAMGFYLHRSQHA
ncbi:hypothetical protein AN218_22325 [Streptomyces nanshensis]|uniref:Uncharacterized protein n=1 Tax=Streptomyces nanshensis TaxID=518642 RepID=A0A1E7KZ80_9ACTN|nr:hypothetical protein AN218_22325 [Streptomyces nanshensis]